MLPLIMAGMSILEDQQKKKEAKKANEIKAALGEAPEPVPQGNGLAAIGGGLLSKYLDGADSAPKAGAAAAAAAPSAREEAAKAAQFAPTSPDSVNFDPMAPDAGAGGGYLDPKLKKNLLSSLFGG